MAVYEIPLSAETQKFAIDLANVTYRMRLTWDEAAGGFWALDIAQADGTLLLAGIPLVTGTDLLEQHACLGFGGRLIVRTDRDAGEVPTLTGLGTTSHLLFITDS